MKLLFCSIITFCAFTQLAGAQTSIPSQDIAKHMNDSVSTSSKIYGARELDRSQITLLYIGGVFPDQLFNIVIKSPAREQLKLKNTDDLKGRKIQVTGRVTEWGGKPQIVVREQTQIKID